MRGLRIALTAGLLALGASPALAVGPNESSICKTLRTDTGSVRLPGHGRHFSVLVTGDSMSYPIDQEMGVEAPAGMVVHSDRHDGTGLTTNVVNWPRLAVSQVARFHPAATVISIGGRDGGIPLLDPAHGGNLTECCGTRWLRLYANLLRPLARAYVRGGLGHVYWLTLPAPEEAARAPLYEAVNAALGVLAAEFPGEITLIPVSAVVSPGGFQQQITYEGLQVSPRTPDGIHLNHAGACVERSLVVEAMLSAGQLLPARGAFGVPIGWGSAVR